MNKCKVVKYIKNMKMLLINCSTIRRNIFKFDDPGPQEGQSSNSFSSCHNREGRGLKGQSHEMDTILTSTEFCIKFLCVK
jgi:hypothetical protein